MIKGVLRKMRRVLHPNLSPPPFLHHNRLHHGDNEEIRRDTTNHKTRKTHEATGIGRAQAKLSYEKKNNKGWTKKKCLHCNIRNQNVAKRMLSLFSKCVISSKKERGKKSDKDESLWTLVIKRHRNRRWTSERKQDERLEQLGSSSSDRQARGLKTHAPPSSLPTTPSAPLPSASSAPTGRRGTPPTRHRERKSI